MITSYDIERAETNDDIAVLAHMAASDFELKIPEASADVLTALAVMAAITNNVHLLRISAELIGRRNQLKLITRYCHA